MSLFSPRLGWQSSCWWHGTLLCVLAMSPCRAALDLDGDGVADLWRQLHPGAGNLVDTDGDGFIDRLEAVAGTDPMDRGSRLEVASLEVSSGDGSVRFQWQAVPGKRYAVEQYDVAAARWQESGTVESGAAGPLELAVPGAGESGLFRLKVEDIDHDGDGLNGWEEFLLGFSDHSPYSSGQAGRRDFAAAMARLEGTGTLLLSDGSEVARRPVAPGEASRFLAQASFGADSALIAEVAAQGIVGWLDQQFALPMTSSVAAMNQNGQAWDSYMWRKGWWRLVMLAPDQVRQRVGYALSQILVVSGAGNDLIRGNPSYQGVWYDMFLGKGFGGYRDLLRDVTYSPLMGFYLSHLKNRKSNPALGRFPDENYAREIMQLFTIGLWKLNPDGTRVLDPAGAPVPTYDNTTIMEMAKVFTGFSFGSPSMTSFFGGGGAYDYLYPMKVWEGEHEPGEKRIFNGVVIPAGQTGDKDVSDALDALCNHANIGPFIGRRLIQRLTASNPSPDYVRRVAEAWADDGTGARGNLRAVIEAVLLDPEARTPGALGDASGKVREPYLRLTALLRAFKARNSKGTFPVWTGDMPKNLGQQPLFAPSVFNFYLPDHQPAGELRDRGLFAPELEIATSDRMINTDNLLQRIIDRGMDPFANGAADILYCDFTLEKQLSADPAALVDHLDALLTHGAMSASTRAAVVAAVAAQAGDEARVETAVHLIVESPDFVVLK